MKHTLLILCLIAGFAVVTTPTQYHLGPTEIFLYKVGYDILSFAFWLGFLYLLWKYCRSERKIVSGFLPLAWRWLLAGIFALLVVGTTLLAKTLAYGPYWSCPDRPMFAFGWPIPWKWETAGGPKVLLWALPLNVILCFGLFLFLFGFRKLKHFLIAFITPPIILIACLIATGDASEIYSILFSKHHRESITTETEELP